MPTIPALFPLLFFGCQNQEGPYSFPLQNPDDFYGTIGVDHDPEEFPDGTDVVNCQNYEGRSYPGCYDGHDGTDYALKGSFETMDAGSSEIIAAADGTVVDADDGHYDRCHMDLFTVDVYCDGHEMEPNFVTLEHADGFRTKYLHMQSGSVAVQIGDTVNCGDFLGLVGSSGFSTGPHLHFEVESPEGDVIDPYAGEYSQDESYWVDQNDSPDYPEKRCRE